MDQSIVFWFFGGVSQDGLSLWVDYDKVLYELARWLLSVGICLMAEGIRLEKWRKIERLACYRCETIKIWWKRKFAGSLIYGISASTVLFITVMGADIVNAGRIPEEAWKVFVLWIAHITTILSFLLVMDLSGIRKLAPAILLLLEGFTFLVGFANTGAFRFMFGMWGMYFQSRWYFCDSGVSIPASLLIQGLLIVLGYLTGVILLKKAA